MTHLSCLRYLRNSKRSPNPFLSVIMLTGPAIRQNIEHARDSGVNEIILKPITAESLCDRIKKVIENTLPFITADNYRGPCRRRKTTEPPNQQERRKRDIKIIKYR